MATEAPVVLTVAPPVVLTVAPERTPAVAPAVEKTKKVKKTSVKTKPRNPSLHPPYFEMIKEAIVTLKERTGSSQYAITKFIEENQKHLPVNVKKQLLTQLKKLVAAGKLVKVKASYKLPAATAPAKKKPVAKPKTVKKATPVKKKTVAKPKPALKPKAVAKPKAAAKAKIVAKPKAAAKTKAKAPAKVGRASSRTAPATPKKATVKSLKPKSVIAKKVGGAKKTKK